MRLLFLGTAAAEGYPGIFCSCDSCNEARRLGGRNLRLRSALLVNDDLLIDFGPDLLASAQRFNLNLWKVTTGLVTHAHMDHFFMGNFEMRADAFTGRKPPPTLHLYGPRDMATILGQGSQDLGTMKALCSEMSMEVNTVHAFDEWEREEYSFRAYQANHAVGSLEALFYSVDDGDHAILYATDTGYFPESTQKALVGRTFDVIVLEETMGDGDYDQHLGFDSFLQQVKWIRSNGLVRPGGRVIAHHFSHSGNPLHAELEAIFHPHDVEVAYDGMEVML